MSATKRHIEELEAKGETPFPEHDYEYEYYLDQQQEPKPETTKS